MIRPNPRFKCQKCGKCCHNLTSENQGITMGITLLVNEINLFNKQYIKPAIGQGIYPNHPNFQVFAYQLTQDSCPHLRKNICSIYSNRPVSCRQFPFSLELGNKGPLLSIDMNCFAVKKLLELGDEFEFNERKDADKLFLIKMMVNDNRDIHWLYDLKTDGWINFNSL